MITKIKKWTESHHEQIVIGSVYAGCIAVVVAIGVAAKRAEDKYISEATERGDLVVRSYLGDINVIPAEMRR